MARITLIVASIVGCMMLVAGCSSKSHEPITPQDTTPQAVRESIPLTTRLWGYWQVDIDLKSKTATAVRNRTADFTLNVVTFLNGNPQGVSFANIVTDDQPGYVDVGLDVTLTHPMDWDMWAYDGYDVRGVLVGNGSATLKSTAISSIPLWEAIRCFSTLTGTRDGSILLSSARRG